MNPILFRIFADRGNRCHREDIRANTLYVLCSVHMKYNVPLMCLPIDRYLIRSMFEQKEKKQQQQKQQQQQQSLSHFIRFRSLDRLKSIRSPAFFYSAERTVNRTKAF